MSKELVAIAALTFTLLGSVYTFGVKVGALTAQVQQQTTQIDRMTAAMADLTRDLQGTRLELMRIIGGHVEPAVRRTR